MAELFGTGLGPQQPDLPAQARDAVEANPAPAVADSDNPEGRDAMDSSVSTRMISPVVASATEVM